MSEKEPWRGNFLPAPQAFDLEHACALVNDALRSPTGYSGHCYLVGSAVERRDYRDVDIRYIMDDAEYDRVFGDKHAGAHCALWVLMCSSISLWLSKQSGLPVDFQIQRQSHANEAFPKGQRHAIGLFVDYKSIEK